MNFPVDAGKLVVASIHFTASKFEGYRDRFQALRL